MRRILSLLIVLLLLIAACDTVETAPEPEPNEPEPEGMAPYNVAVLYPASVHTSA